MDAKALRQPVSTAVSAAKLRRLAALTFLAFLCVSALLHFMAGPLVESVWVAYRDQVTDTRVSILTLTRLLHETPLLKPTPKPTPPPVLPQPSRMHVTPIRYREVAAFKPKPSKAPAALRRAQIVLLRPQVVEPTAAPPAPVSAPNFKPARAKLSKSLVPIDSGQDQLAVSGSVQWGDDNPARVVKMPPVLASSGGGRHARVEVEVAPDGSVMSVKLVQSSGDGALDDAALDAARKSSYAPATLNGMPVHGGCIFEYPPADASST
jgi:TonB family protein